MKRSKMPLGKRMSEFSQELGVTTPKKSKMGRGMLMAAGSILGYAVIRGIFNRMR